jgi:hypothetical protein
VDDALTVTVYVQVELEPGLIPQPKTNVTIIPKPDKGEYSCTRELIQDWGQEYMDNAEYGSYPEPNPIRSVMLNAESLRGRILIDGEVTGENPLLLMRRRMQAMLSELNLEQVFSHKFCKY